MANKRAKRCASLVTGDAGPEGPEDGAASRLQGRGSRRGFGDSAGWRPSARTPSPPWAGAPSPPWASLCLTGNGGPAGAVQLHGETSWPAESAQRRHRLRLRRGSPERKQRAPSPRRTPTQQRPSRRCPRTAGASTVRNEARGTRAAHGPR